MVATARTDSSVQVLRTVLAFSQNQAQTHIIKLGTSGAERSLAARRDILTKERLAWITLAIGSPERHGSSGATVFGIKEAQVATKPRDHGCCPSDAYGFADATSSIILSE